jgi:DNA polymerase (family X)
MTKNEIAEILEEMGTLLELQGANPFKSRAFHNASRAVEGIPDDIASLVSAGKLREVKGIGEGIARVITELVEKGASQEHKELRGSVPEGVLEMLRVQGLGPKKVKLLHEKLKIASIDALEAAAQEGKLASLDGFGKKSEENILKGIQALRSHGDRTLYPIAAAAAGLLLAFLKKERGVIRAEIAGSLRRRKETVGDIDLLLSAGEKVRARLMDLFTGHPDVVSVIAKGETKSSVVLPRGLNCDLRIVSDDEFPFALNYFTGSKEHNVEMRSRARKHGWSLNEYALSKLDEAEATRKPGRPPTCKDEADIYEALGLQYVPPELRENNGEFEAAETGGIPVLVEETDIRGTFHCHSTYSDGVNTIEQMAAAARRKGWSYLGIADHSKSAGYAGGLSIDRLKAQMAEIDEFNAGSKDFRIFKGTECDILPDGSLDFPDKVLATLDYVVVSIHSNFSMSEKDMTRRIVKALRNKYVTILGHPTGRLLLNRDPYPVNMAQVIDAAAENGKCIEINSHPMRLDLDWRLCRSARDKGVKIAINPDAHSIDGLHDVAYGVGIARKGWLRKEDVVNTGSIKDVLGTFALTRREKRT